MPARMVSLVGHCFGLLEVLEHAGFNRNRQSLYRCRCECGGVKTIRGSDLTTGKVRSCGVSCALKRQRRPRVRVSVIGGPESSTRFG